MLINKVPAYFSAQCSDDRWFLFVNASFQFSVQLRDARIPASLAGGSCRWRNKAGMRPGR